MPAAEARAAVAADSVYLINEDDGGGRLLRHLKEVAHTACPDADEKFDEFRTRDVEKWHIRLTGDGPREHGLTGTGRTHQKHAPRDAGADLEELLRAFQKVHDLLQFLLSLAHARHILEEGALAGVLGRDDPRAGLAERKRLHGAALDLTRRPPDKEADQKQRRQERQGDAEPIGRAAKGFDADG